MNTERKPGELDGCHNCLHHYVNHKACDLPTGVSCGGTKWEPETPISPSPIQDKLDEQLQNWNKEANRPQMKFEDLVNVIRTISEAGMVVNPNDEAVKILGMCNEIRQGFIEMSSKLVNKLDKQVTDEEILKALAKHSDHDSAYLQLGSEATLLRPSEVIKAMRELLTNKEAK